MESSHKLVYGKDMLKRGLCFFAFLFILFFPHPSRAMSQDVKTVITTSLYGVAAGTVLGLAALPFTQDLRGVFVGSSVGLYTGMVIGFYHIWNREDPYNPLRTSWTEPGKGSYSLAQPELKIDVPVYRF